MAACPHLVIDAGGRCEWYFECVIGNAAYCEAIQGIDVQRRQLVEPDAKLLAARWAALFGEEEDYRNAMEAFGS
jgi:hypothetical protein